MLARVTRVEAGRHKMALKMCVDCSEKSVQIGHIPSIVLTVRVTLKSVLFMGKLNRKGNGNESRLLPFPYTAG